MALERRDTRACTALYLKELSGAAEVPAGLTDISPCGPLPSEALFV